MRLCDRVEIARLVESGEIAIAADDGEGPTFLDEHRLGLHLDGLFRLDGEVDLAQSQSASVVPLQVDNAHLEPGSFYLGVSRERFRLGRGFAASLHTRSRYARLGLEVLGSSNFVVPGFGTTGPAPLVFEISVRRLTKGLDAMTAYCFLLLYHLDWPRETPNLGDYRNRFPLRSRHTDREVSERTS